MNLNLFQLDPLHIAYPCFKQYDLSHVEGVINSSLLIVCAYTDCNSLKGYSLNLGIDLLAAPLAVGPSEISTSPKLDHFSQFILLAFRCVQFI